ncbi:RNA polymerase sigma factor [Sphingomonas nostoxanthinifaciens]|uniref:RNA polymerase sigma factor n=1 Tax=Sphingomonas nostoxanthinifaciens TaxID=2872652 RepID=UPI001CC21F13|nr:sigma-70 family RNA polymerase sigma factor [Sphingomonas nostoxanthinifaciens]UAK22853.1 sigma-70 family RNA polymerase sigma factor [Sphingomonas nostoxanthinifaciens]
MTQGGMQAVFMENQAVLLRFLRARGAGGEAEDVLQDMWLKLGVVDAGPISEPLSYLYRMADNQLLDRHRARTRRARRESEWGESMQVQAPSPEQALDAREKLIAAEQALTDLGERTHSILTRYRVDGVSQKEIARELGVSLSLVEKHLQRAYRALVAVRRRVQGETIEGAGSTLPDKADAGS